jgi:hypothetical protein
LRTEAEDAGALAKLPEILTIVRHLPGLSVSRTSARIAVHPLSENPTKRGGEIVVMSQGFGWALALSEKHLFYRQSDHATTPASFSFRR